MQARRSPDEVPPGTGSTPGGRLTDREYWDAVWAAKRAPRPAGPRPHPSSYYRAVLGDLLRTHLPRRPGARVLEVGCGGGAWLVHFHRAWGYAVTGCDSSPEGCRQARQTLAAAEIDGVVMEGDLFALEGTYDVVFSSGLVEHFDDPGAVLGKLASLLAPGGILVTLVPNLTGLSGLYHRCWKPETFDTHRPITLAEFAAWYRDAGLRICAMGALGSVVPRRLPRRAIQARHPTLYRLLWPFALRPLIWATGRACLMGYRRFGLRFESERFSPYLYAIGRQVGTVAA